MPMGHIAYMRKQFHSIKSYAFNNFHFEDLNDPFLQKLETPSLKDGFCKVWLKLARWFWRKKSENETFFFCHLSMYFWYFLLTSPWKKTWPFVWKKKNKQKIWFIFMQCVKLKLVRWFCRRRWKSDYLTNRRTKTAYAYGN